MTEKRSFVQRLREIAGKYDEYGVYEDLVIEAAERIEQLEEQVKALLADQTAAETRRLNAEAEKAAKELRE